MTKRLSAGVLLAAAAVFLTAVNADAARPSPREWRGKEDPYSSGVPLFFRGAPGTTWVQVGQNCSPADTANSSHSPAQVWCFEGANGDSTWPSRGTQGLGNWGHWSKFNPPVPPPSKWHISRRNTGPTTGVYNAWCGCDSLGTNPSCSDIAFWVFKEGYGDDWNYSLTLDMSGQNATTGGTIRFDLRYDSECNYDYSYLEYFNNSTSQWQVVTGPNGDAKFNAVSGNLCTGFGGVGRCCGNDYFHHSDQNPASVPFHGNSVWLTNVTFPMPAQAGGMRLRWRGFSDGAWSDADGSGDTDGILAIDNVAVTFTAPNPDVVVSDNFEDGAFTPNATSGTASWTPGGLEGNVYDGWHLEFDPKYKNKGTTCTFSDDWMWASKPAAGSIPANGFSYLLVSPKIQCNGWTGGVLEFSAYQCAPSDRTDYTNTHIRFYNTATTSWSLWNDFDGFIIFQGCDFWNFNDTENLTPFLGAEVDSLQLAWEMLDIDQPGDFEWGFHTAVTYLIDNVSVGRFDGSASQFTARGIDIFSDTFSRSEPSHTPFLQNAEEGNWSNNAGTRLYVSADSLGVEINDYDGITASNVRMWWRVGTGTPPTFGAWRSKLMVFSDPNPTSPTDEGTYRITIGNTVNLPAGEDFSSQEAGSVPGTPAMDPIWDPGQTIEYYVRTVDNAANATVWPGTAADTPPQPFRFQILPQNRTVDGTRKVLLVDDYTRNSLDFERSTGFQATGGAGFGNFTNPVFDQDEDMVERALALMYGGSEDLVDGVYGNPKWDIYNVQGGGSSVQREPRVLSRSSRAIGGIAGDTGTPNYNAVIWLQGSFDQYSYADTTRIELKTFLDQGGHLFSSGDDVAYFLGTGGVNADSTIGFLCDYLGISFPLNTDDEASDRVLDMVGVSGTSLAGVQLGIYGECPGLRRTFDLLTECPDVPGVHVSTTLATYQNDNILGTANGRAAVIKNVRIVGNGVAVHTGFDVACLLSDRSRACLLNRVFTVDFGLPATSFAGCINNGTDAPVVANGRFGFELAQASPNPFAEATSIRFSVPNRSHVSIEVYNILGQKVRTLVDETLEANSYVREWDGRADAGTKVSSGIYFYKMVAGDYSATRKAVMLK